MQHRAINKQKAKVHAITNFILAPSSLCVARSILINKLMQHCALNKQKAKLHAITNFTLAPSNFCVFAINSHK